MAKTSSNPASSSNGSALVDGVVAPPGQLVYVPQITGTLERQSTKSAKIEKAIQQNLKGLGYGR